MLNTQLLASILGVFELPALSLPKSHIFHRFLAKFVGIFNFFIPIYPGFLLIHVLIFIMSKVAIILSSYNGENYIKEQIDSLLAQDFPDFSIFVRDDGSTDGTLQVLEGLPVTLVQDAPGQPNLNLGFGPSFTAALLAAYRDSRGFDYFAFCDQDDYWEPGKLAAAARLLDGATPDQPALFSHNYYVCDDKLNILSSWTNTNPMQEGVTFSNMAFEGVFPGFTLVINRRLAELAFAGDPTPDIFYHDKWVSLITLGLSGNIFFDTAPLARYRRHQGAVSSTDKGGLAKLRWRINNVLKGDFCLQTHRMLELYRQLFFDQVSPDSQHFLEVFTSGSYFAKLFYPGSLRRSASGSIMLRLMILIGKI